MPHRITNRLGLDEGYRMERGFDGGLDEGHGLETGVKHSTDDTLQGDDSVAGAVEGVACSTRRLVAIPDDNLEEKMELEQSGVIEHGLSFEDFVFFKYLLCLYVGNEVDKNEVDEYVSWEDFKKTPLVEGNYVIFSKGYPHSSTSLPNYFIYPDNSGCYPQESLGYAFNSNVDGILSAGPNDFRSSQGTQAVNPRD